MQYYKKVALGAARGVAVREFPMAKGTWIRRLPGVLDRKAAGAIEAKRKGQAKGLTVQATIVATIEDNVIPRSEVDDAEERRLLYVALTRARSYLYVTVGAPTSRPDGSIRHGAGVGAAPLFTVPR